MTWADLSVKPKYWCKHCKTFVRDTKLEKQNHEATPKHQGNLQRFLRDLHRGHEREERDAQRAKDEVARLNGITADSTAAGNGPQGRKPAIPAASDKKQAGSADRKRQLQQLADMGISVPEEARREMAMAGDWQTQSVTPMYEKVESVKNEEDGEEQKPSALAIGVRKRRFDGDEEKEEAGVTVVRKGWGSTSRTWNAGNDGDLDALLESTKTITPKPNGRSDAPSVTDSATTTVFHEQPSHESKEPPGEQSIKREDSGDATMSTEKLANPYPVDTTLKTEEDVGVSGVVFKKRKAKPIRQKG